MQPSPLRIHEYFLEWGFSLHSAKYRKFAEYMAESLFTVCLKFLNDVCDEVLVFALSAFCYATYTPVRRTGAFLTLLWEST